MKELKSFTIQFVGLKAEKHHFEYQIDNAFFKHFEYTEFNKVNVTANLLLDKKTTFLELYFKVNGSVNINCDITNEPYDQCIDGEFKLVVKFSNEFNNDNEDILIVPHGEYEINVAQYIYEIIVLSIPAKRIHPGVEDGTLQSDILDKLEELSPKSEQNKENTEEIDPRWNTLKKLLTDK